MSLLSKKVSKNPVICGLEISFSGVLVPSIVEGFQPFYNSDFSDVVFEGAYSGRSYLEFSEVCADSKSGPIYKQSVAFRFPSMDRSRAERLAILHKTKFVKLLLSDGSNLVIGRNDFYQNAPPKVSIKSNHYATEVEIECSAIMPAGFVSISASFMPSLFPLYFNYE